MMIHAYLPPEEQTGFLLLNKPSLSTRAQPDQNHPVHYVVHVIFFSQGIMIKMSSFLSPCYSFCPTVIMLVNFWGVSICIIVILDSWSQLLSLS